MVYPKKNKEAKPLDNVSWNDFLEIIGEEWIPGKNVPFDPVASKVSRDSSIKVVILNGNDLNNLDNYLKDNNFIGTVIG